MSERMELPATPVARTKSDEPIELPAVTSIASTSTIAEIAEAPRDNDCQAMSNRKKDWISDEQHNGRPLRDIKQDPRAGSGIELVSPLEEDEGMQLHQASPENEISNPKFPSPRPQNDGLQALPGQNQENRAVYLNREEEEEIEGVEQRAEDDWHFTLRRIDLLSLRPNWSNPPISPQPTYLK
ncbi:hypothetical protein FKW77_004086 [Venturia effusa]|uniref:Uncharacterized protein n=1 Tax=Venturia effusa TaxID=50376 RepID=A0A517LQ64_9PEZI|nr:hypothetical protein FKW77_004086 [Venturia effusa]